MTGQAIFLPFIGMLVLTFAVWVLMYARRIPYMKRERIHPQRVATPHKVMAELPDEIQNPAYNLANLLQLPVIFYALCLYLYAVDAVDSVYVIAAWLFFVLRILHSIVQCTVNKVMLRFYVYSSSSVVLWFMLGRAAFAALR